MRIILLAAVLSAGCTAADGEWPSLARRPAEVAVPPTSATEPAAPLATTPVPPALQARIAAAARDIDAAADRVAAQIRTVAALPGGATGSPGWAQAQLELTRLERTGNVVADLRARTTSIARDLAAANASAVTLSPLITRLDTLEADYRAAFDAAQARFSR